MCDNTGLVISDYDKFGRTRETYTYVSDAHNSTSWLDHFICTHSVYSIATVIHIIHKLPSSDHLPVGLVVFTCVTPDKLDNVPNEKQGVKKSKVSYF